MKKLYTFIAAAAFLMLPFAAKAACTGTSQQQDGEYYSTDHSKEWTQGYTWEFTTAGSAVNISVTSLDDFEGLAAAYLFDRTTGFAEYPMTLNGKTATYTLNGYSAGQEVVFIVKFLVDGGDVFTKRFVYAVGDDCASSGEPAKGCSGHSTANDEFYTKYDAAATGFERGYDWAVETVEGGVEITVEFLEQWVGMAAPYLFEFHDGNMTEHEMKWVGQRATYTLTGYTEGQQVTFLVKIAYAYHVAFTERITYTVGQVCEETPDALNEVQIDMNAPMEIYDALGRRISGSLSDQPRGMYIVRQGGVTRKIVRK